jgi:hypothetical protein
LIFGGFTPTPPYFLSFIFRSAWFFVLCVAASGTVLGENEGDVGVEAER